jgi:hypothetical protein
MFDFNKKKISLSILLITLAIISFISKVKIKVEIPTAFDETVDKNPTEWSVMDVVNLFGCTFNYNNTLFVLLLFVIMSILLFIFSDDMQLSKNLNSLKAKVIKWDIKLIIISILFLVVILVLGKSCRNNTKEATPKAIEEAPVTPYDTVAAAPAAESVDSVTEEEIIDSISLNENSKPKKIKDNKALTAFGKATKEVQQTEEGLASGAGASSGEGLSFEELRSQDASKNNVSTQLLSKYKSIGEKDK